LLNTVFGSLSSGVAASTSSYESIATITGSDQAEITFSSIPNTYSHLQIRGIYKDTNTGAAGNGSMYIRFNGDTGANYSDHQLFGTGSVAGTDKDVSASQIKIIGAALRTDSGNPFVAASIIDFHNYASTTNNKTVRAIAGCNDNSANISIIALSSGAWYSTSAITSITLRNYVAGFGTSSTFALYGIKG
jgi:hypothetical protein